MNAQSRRTLSSTARVGASALLALSGLATSAAGVLAGQGGGSGSIQTTTDACDAPAPQNANDYAGGDELYIRGTNFEANSAFSYTIVGQPGKASGDPGATVASGTGSTAADGSFCIDAYTIAGDDWGEYKATVNQGKTKKSDNYNVDVATTDNAGDESDNAGDESDNAGDESDNAGDESDNAGDESDNAGDETGPAGDETGPAGDETDNAGDETGPAGDETDNAGDETGPAGDETGPTQEVLGTTDTGSGIELPATDMVSGSASPALGLIMAGLALMVSAGVLLAPSRRRTSDDVA